MNAPTSPGIKLCGFTRAADVQAALVLDIQYMGFVFYDASPRFVSPTAAKALVSLLPVHIQAVGLFVNHSEPQVKQAVADSGIKILQFHGTETPEFCDKLSQQLGLPYWKAIHVQHNAHSDDLLKSCLAYGYAQALLFDTASPGLVNLWGGTGHTFNWQLLTPLAQLKNVPPLVLSGGLSVQNVAQGIALVKPWAVDVSSGIEAVDTSVQGQEKPIKGVKDRAKMAAFVNAARNH